MNETYNKQLYEEKKKSKIYNGKIILSSTKR